MSFLFYVHIYKGAKHIICKEGSSSSINKKTWEKAWQIIADRLNDYKLLLLIETIKWVTCLLWPCEQKMSRPLSHNINFLSNLLTPTACTTVCLCKWQTHWMVSREVVHECIFVDYHSVGPLLPVTLFLTVFNLLYILYVLPRRVYGHRKEGHWSNWTLKARNYKDN